MQLYRRQGHARNFSDELNTLIWPRLLPDFFDDDPAEIFLGIGSLLDARHAATPVKLVADAGYGGYERLPTLDATWVIHWVRGPHTCRALGLPDSAGLGDPAMLLPIAGWNYGALADHAPSTQAAIQPRSSPRSEAAVSCSARHCMEPS